MPKAIQHSFVFITLIILVSVAFGDAFDQTVTQLKTLKVELEQTQASIVEKRELVETQITDFRENHPLNAPKDMFESDADYAERLQRLESTISQRLSELEHQHLSELLSRRLRIQTQLVRLHRTVFLTNNVTVTLGEYDANNEFFPITFQVGDQSIENHLDIIKDDARILYENWEEVSVTGWIVVDPGYRRGLAKVELKYPSLWEDGIAWTIDTVYELGDNNSIAFSPDGEYLATGSNTEYGVATIWKVENGEKFREMDHGDWVYAVAFSPDGEYFATAGQDETRYSSAGKAVLWEMDGGTKVRKKQLDSYAYVVTFDPNSDYWAVARQPYSSGGKALVWRVDSGDHVWSMIYNAYRSTIHALTFSPNGAYLATGNVREYRSDLDKATLWRVDTGSADLNFRHKNGVYAVAFSPNGAYLATGNEGSVTLWEISSGRSVRQIELPDTIAYAVAFSPDGEYLAVGKTNGYINFFRIGAEDITLETEILKAKSIHAGSQVSDLAWHPDGSLISDGKRVYRTLLQPIFTELVAQPVSTRKDVNGDGVVNVDDLVLVAASFGKSVATHANPNPDVNRDGVVNLADIIEVVLSLQGVAAAPSADLQTISTLSAENLQQWINQAKQRFSKDEVSQRGITVLEQLLATLIEAETVPAETTLLPNYPNPFNPETWIPYQLAESADVTLTFYAADGRLVRTLTLGNKPLGIYQTRSRAAYWDGRNELGESVASGIYFYTLTAGEFTATGKMLLTK